MEGSSWMSVAIRCVANCMRAEYGWSVRSYGGIVAPCTCERDGQTPLNLKMQGLPPPAAPTLLKSVQNLC
jgi:hypothetical protein